MLEVLDVPDFSVHQFVQAFETLQEMMCLMATCIQCFKTSLKSWFVGHSFPSGKQC